MRFDSKLHQHLLYQLCFYVSESLSHVQKDQAKDPDEEVSIVFADSSGPFAQLTL